MRKRAVELTDELFEMILTGAKVYRCDALSLLKNLIAEVPKEDLSRIQTLLVFWEARLGADKTNQHGQLVKFLRKHASRRSDFFDWALLGGRTPSLTMTVDFFDDSLIQVLGYHREVILRGETASQYESSRLIGFLARHQKILTPLNVRDILVQEGFKKALCPFDQAHFEKLPKGIRRWFLNDNLVRDATIAPAFLSRIQSSPLDFPDTPEALDQEHLHNVILPRALRDFSSRDFRSTNIEELLRRPELESFSEKILNAINCRTKNTVRKDSQQVLSLPSNLAISSNNLLKNTLLFLSRPLASRLEWMMGQSMQDALRLEKNLPIEYLHEAIKACTCRSILQKYQKVFEKSHLTKNELPHLLKCKNASREFLDFFAPELFVAGETEAILSLFETKAACLGSAAPEHLSICAFQQFILECAANPARFGRFLKNAPTALLEKLFGGKSDIFEKFQSALSKTLAARGTAELRQSLRRSMIELAPDSIGNFVGWEIGKKEFSELITIRTKAKSRAPATFLLLFAFKDGSPAWEFFWDERRCKRILRPLIRAHRPDLITRMNQLEAQSLLSNADFKEKLIAHLATSSHSPLGISMGVRCELIPWIREHFKNKPTLSIAYQLALAFSIKDTAYLKKLCFERWASPLRKNPGQVFNRLYSLHQVPKKSGGFREIHAPCAELKRLQSRILENGFNRIPMSRSAHGFHRKRSILTNASPHAGKTCVVNVDIDSFFQTTSHNLILQATAHLASGHLSYGARQALADILSHKGVLPTGAPTSPAIGNLVLRAADAAIAKVASHHGIDYTRYADDLTFSGHRHTVKILPFVEKVLGQLGYKLNSKKTNIYRRGRRQMVTGLVVNEKPNLPRSVRRNLRAAVHTAAKGEAPHWNGRPMNKHELAGRIALLNLLDKDTAAKLKAKLAPAASAL